MLWAVLQASTVGLLSQSPYIIMRGIKPWRHSYAIILSKLQDSDKFIRPEQWQLWNAIVSRGVSVTNAKASYAEHMIY